MELAEQDLAVHTRRFSRSDEASCRVFVSYERARAQWSLGKLEDSLASIDAALPSARKRGP